MFYANNEEVDSNVPEIIVTDCLEKASLMNVCVKPPSLSVKSQQLVFLELLTSRKKFQVAPALARMNAGDVNFSSC